MAKKAFLFIYSFLLVTLLNAQEVKVDKYGQLINADFPAKIKSDNELKEDSKKDAVYYSKLTPPKRDKYGGLLCSKNKYNLKATGFFHTQQLKNGRWVLVDPNGNAYYSVGVNGVGYSGDTYTYVKGRENIYEWLPEFTNDKNNPNYIYHNAYLNDNSDNFSFYVANKIKKDGSFNATNFYNESVQRLRKWGFNSEGGFSNPGNGDLNFPRVYVLSLPEDYRISGSSIIDIYKTGAKQAFEKSFEQQVASLANNPLVIGYFFGNEIDYHQFKNIIPSKKASEAAIKQALIDFLIKKYERVSLFNNAWKTNFSSFEEAAETSIALTTDQSMVDMYSFFEKYIDKYYGDLVAALRRYDKNHLTLGDRYFTPVLQDVNLRKVLCSAAAKHLDVLSYNYYTYATDIELLNDIYKHSGKPIMLTEFHYGDPTQGQTSSIQMMDNELQKGLAYRNYVEQAFSTGFVVGTHWFEFLDQAVTGRWFQGYYGEGFGIGLLNVADRPYKTLLEEIMKTNYQIYDVALGKKEPFSYDFGPGKSKRNNSKEIVIFRSNQPFTVDGMLDSNWAESEIITLDKEDIVSGSAQENSEAKIRLTYDDNYLYIFADIKDDTPSTNAFDGEALYNGDGIEIFTGASKPQEGGSLSVSDRQVIIGASNNYTPKYQWYNGVLVQPETKTAIRKTSEGYSIEAALPFKDLNINDLYKSRKIRFDIGFNNGDERQRNTQYMWNGTETNSRTRDNWGILIFN